MWGGNRSSESDRIDGEDVYFGFLIYRAESSLLLRFLKNNKFKEKAA